MTTRDTIISEALHCFIHDDYDHVTLNEIASRSGITKGGIYHYFASKEEILFEAVRYAVDKLFSPTIERMNKSDSIEDTLKQTFSFDEMNDDVTHAMGSSDFAAQSSFFYLLFVATKKFPELKDFIAERYDRYALFIEQWLSEAQAEGKINPELDCRVIAFQVLAMIEGTMLIGFFDTKIDFKRLGEDMFENVWKQISR